MIFWLENVSEKNNSWKSVSPIKKGWEPLLQKINDENENIARNFSKKNIILTFWEQIEGEKEQQRQ
jgi:hypothetical protein